MPYVSINLTCYLFLELAASLVVILRETDFQADDFLIAID